MKSKILVFVQFSIILLMLILPITRTPYFYIGLVIVLLGVSIGLLALYKNRLHNFNIRPDIKENSLLITDGIYRYIRHPMYTSVLVTMFGIMTIHISPLEILLYVLLCINMLIKMFYEESLWHSNRTDYLEYSKNTYRLIPYIF